MPEVISIAYALAEGNGGPILAVLEEFSAYEDTNIESITERPYLPNSTRVTIDAKIVRPGIVLELSFDLQQATHVSGVPLVRMLSDRWRGFKPVLTIHIGDQVYSGSLPPSDEFDEAWRWQG